MACYVTSRVLCTSIRPRSYAKRGDARPPNDTCWIKTFDLTWPGVQLLDFFPSVQLVTKNVDFPYLEAAEYPNPSKFGL